MGILNPNSFNTSYGSTTGTFQDNANGNIGALDMQQFSKDINERTPVIGLTSIADLKAIVTANILSAGAIAIFRDTTRGKAYVYQLYTATDAEDQPTIVRPNDYATTSNEKVWRLLASSTAYSSASIPGSAFDKSAGYLIGDLVVYTGTTNNRPYICIDNATGSAAWRPLPWTKASAGAPTVSDDIAAGYLPGDTWIDTSVSPKQFYVLADNSVGAADWLRKSGEDSFVQTVNITSASQSLEINPLADIVKVNLRLDWTNPTITGFIENKPLLFLFVQDYTGAGSTPVIPFDFIAPSNISLNNGVSIALQANTDGVADTVMFLGFASNKAQQLGGVSVGTSNQI